jgi:hypothetical protein
LHGGILFSLFYVDSQVRTEHFALKAAGAKFGMGRQDRLEPFLRNFGGFFPDFLGADFQADIAAFAPFQVEADGYRFFLLRRGASKATVEYKNNVSV